MTFDTTVLRVMLRLARRREAAELDAVAVRLGAPAAAVRASMRRLDAAGLVERRGDQAPRLTLTGFALAVSMLSEKASDMVPVAARPSRAA
jgi:Mn-dependent DtxR family transcriptional regulator